MLEPASESGAPDDMIRKKDPPLPPEFDARQLAWLAEWADGFREKELALVVSNANGDFDLKPEKEVQHDKERVILRVFTEAVQPKRLKPMEVSIKDPSGRTVRLDQDCDAAFWSESSIEKFLFPYYYSQRLLTEEQMQKLKENFDKREVFAIVHMPPSKPGIITRGKISSIAVLEKVGTAGMEGGGAIVPTPLHEFLR